WTWVILQKVTKATKRGGVVDYRGRFAANFGCCFLFGLFSGKSLKPELLRREALSTSFTKTEPPHSVA
ncbi:MAG: hypothetical protein V4773_21965, partial [Verrucomicrobiota bacterium]